MTIFKNLFASILLASGVAAAAQPPVPTALPMQAQMQAQQTRPPAPPTQATKDTMEGYVLGADDVVEITVLGQPEFATRARVKANGTVQLPFIGEQRVAGETALSLAPKIAEKLRSGGYYAKPVVNIEIASFASRYVTLLGAVAQPGLQPVVNIEISSFASRYVVLLGAIAQAGLQPVDRDYRLSEIIARAGGLRESGADFVTLTRATGEQRDYPFDKLASGGPQDDPMVSPGDKIFVPEADLFYIYGQINSPGVYPLKGGPMTVRKAVARGGGFNASGSASRIKLFRNGVETKVKLDAAIQPGDVLVVGERLF